MTDRAPLEMKCRTPTTTDLALTTMPHRIQLKRTKDWTLPANTVRVDRRTKWRNPWRVGQTFISLTEEAGTPITLDQETAVEFFRRSAFGKNPLAQQFRALVREELAGKNLACWCKLSDPCHADILLEIANEKEAT